MNELFYYCVAFLQYIANNTGYTYEEVNVIIFCILWPLLTLWQTILILQLIHIIKGFKTK